MADPPEYTIRTRTGKLYRGVLGRDIRKIVDPSGRFMRRGFEVRTDGGVWVEVWDEDIAELGAQVQHKDGIGRTGDIDKAHRKAVSDDA